MRRSRRYAAPVPESDTTWPSRLPLLLLAFIIATIAVLPGLPFVVSVPATVCLLWTLRQMWSASVEPAVSLVMAVGAAVAPAAIAAVVLPAVVLDDGQWIASVLGVLAIASGLASASRPRLFLGHLAVVAALHLYYVSSARPLIDVGFFVRGSTRGLLDGVNPYALTFPNPYNASETASFYAPQFVDGDRILLGFPYLPGAVVAYLPGSLLSDVRYVSVAAILVTTWLAWRLATDRVGRLLVAAMPVTPLSLLTTTCYWVEPLLALGVALLATSMARRSRSWGVVSLLLLLSVKQYAIVWLPLERLVRRRLGWSVLALAVALSAVVVVGFFLWDPDRFWLSVVQAQFSQPYRPDSVSLAVDLVNAGLPVPSVALSIGSLASGLLVALWVRVKAPTSTTWTVLGLALSFLATVLMSKQAFANYYFFIHVCIVIGIAAWPADSRRPAAVDVEAREDAHG